MYIFILFYKIYLCEFQNVVGNGYIFVQSLRDRAYSINEICTCVYILFAGFRADSSSVESVRMRSLVGMAY